MVTRKWLREGERKQVNPENLLQIIGIIKTRKKVRWSEEIDEIIYGE